MINLKNIKLKLLFIAIVTLLTSCKKDNDARVTNKSISFESSKWKTKKDSDYPYRDAMLQQLIESDTLKPLNKTEIISLLGTPTRIDSLYLFYMVKQKRIGFFPLHTKTLVVKLSDNDTPNKVLIHD